jgi:hypothetical protein
MGSCSNWGSPSLGPVRMSSRVSLADRGLPGCPWRLFRLQYGRNPRRCQPTTVSGLTRSKDFRQFRQIRESQTQKQQSAVRSRGLGHCHFHTASCCPRARFSRPNSLRHLGEIRRRETENDRLNMEMNFRCTLEKVNSFEADTILANHKRVSNAGQDVPSH